MLMWQTSTLPTKLSTQPLSLISILSVKISSSFCSLCLLVAGGHNCGCYFFPVIFRGLGGKGATIWGQGPWRILLCRVGGLVSTHSHTMKAEDLL